VSFDLAVLAMDEHATAEAARQMFRRCNRSSSHHDGELDRRIEVFYEQLRSRFPDHPPYQDRSPWASTPLATGIDHVIIYLRHGPVSEPALQTIMDLAERHSLIIYDPQSDTAHLPTST
jgi:hypothetical protein